MLIDVDMGTISLVPYQAPQLELESDLGPLTRGGAAERPGGWDRGGLNDNEGGDGNVDSNAMARHQNRVAYKEENKILLGDGESAAPFFQHWPG